jgi:hypothetical protein
MAPGDCIQRQQFGGRRFTTRTKEGDSGGGANASISSSSIGVGRIIPHSTFDTATRTKEGDSVSTNGSISSSSSSSSSIGVGSSIPHSTFDATTYIMGGDRGGGILLGNGCKPVCSSHEEGDHQLRCKSCKELFVNFVNGEAHGYGPVQVDSEGSIRWRRRKRDFCRRGRRRSVMMTAMMMMMIMIMIMK